ALDMAGKDGRGDDDAAGPPACAQRGRVQAVVEFFQPGKAKRADHGQRGAKHDESRYEDRDPQRNICQRVHSITSPRNRNFASATVATKPMTAITIAASKKKIEPSRIPVTRNSSITVRYSVSSAITRSCARGPLTIRVPARQAASASANCA